VGIELAEYESTWLHAKVGIVDGKWLTVGSSNFDALSFFLNHEANLVVRHHEIVNLMQNYFDDAFEGNAATRVFLYEVGERSVLNRMLDAACYFLYRMLMKILTIGRYD
jgi:cardiolipin synthase